MLEALRYALKYKGMLPRVVEFLIFVENATKDGKLDKAERSKVLKHMWAIVKEYEKVNPPPKTAKLVEHPPVKAK